MLFSNPIPRALSLFAVASVLSLAAPATAKGKRAAPIPTPEALGIDVTTAVDLGKTCPGENAGISRCDLHDRCRDGDGAACAAVWREASTAQVRAIKGQTSKSPPIELIEGYAKRGCQVKLFRLCQQIGVALGREQTDVTKQQQEKIRVAWLGQACTVASEAKSPDARGLCGAASKIAAGLSQKSDVADNADVAAVEAMIKAKGSLVGVDLSGKKLAGLTLKGIDASGAKFDGANLRKSSFRDVTLVGASFEKATFFDSAFVGNRLHKATFRRTSMEDVVFDENVADDAIFDNLSIARGTFNLTGKNVTIKGGSLRDAAIRLDLESSTMSSVTIKSGSLKVTAKDSTLEKLSLKKTVVEGCDLVRSRLKDTSMDKVNLKDGTVRDGTWAGVKIEGSVITGMQFKDANLKDVTIVDSKMEDNDFSKTSMAGLNLCECPKCSWRGGKRPGDDAGCVEDHRRD